MLLEFYLGHCSLSQPRDRGMEGSLVDRMMTCLVCYVTGMTPLFPILGSNLLNMHPIPFTFKP